MNWHDFGGGHKPNEHWLSDTNGWCYEEGDSDQLIFANLSGEFDCHIRFTFTKFNFWAWETRVHLTRLRCDHHPVLTHYKHKIQQIQDPVCPHCQKAHHNITHPHHMHNTDNSGSPSTLNICKECPVDSAGFLKAAGFTLSWTKGCNNIFSSDLEMPTATWAVCCSFQKNSSQADCRLQINYPALHMEQVLKWSCGHTVLLICRELFGDRDEGKFSCCGNLLRKRRHQNDRIYFLNTMTYFILISLSTH